MQWEGHLKRGDAAQDLSEYSAGNVPPQSIPRYSARLSSEDGVRPNRDHCEVLKLWQTSSSGRVENREKSHVALSNLHGFVIADIPSRKVVHTVEFPALPPNTDLRPLLNTATHGLALTPDGKELWAASVPTGSVFVYDVQSAKVSPAIAVGQLPNWIAFSPDGRYGCVSNTGSNDCSIVDRKSKKEVARVKVGKAPKRVATLSVAALKASV